MLERGNGRRQRGGKENKDGETERIDKGKEGGKIIIVQSWKMVKLWEILWEKGKILSGRD